MRTLLRGLACCAALLVAGCVGNAVTLDTAAAPKQGMGYLTGIFADSSTQSLPVRKLVITFENQETKTQHTVAFQKEGRELQLVEVPPGTYRVAGWYLAGMFNNPIIDGKPQGVLFTREFKVAADQVHYLGQFTGSSTVTNSGNMVYYNASIRPERIFPAEADRQAFSQRFPNFSRLPLKAAYF
jgi:hypothetical protein